jgi:tetratricopeptide (TPR) repeat protein
METPEQIKQEAEAAFERGKTHYEKKEYDLAIKEYTEAIRLDPNFALAYLKRADAYIMVKDELDDDAVNDIYKACELDPHISRQYNNQGKCSFCGLPACLAHGLMNLENDKNICGKCINKNEISNSPYAKARF